MDKTARHIVFIGRVQGVGFRFTALNIAGHYRLTGLVRNLTDGSVEMIAQGNPEDIDSCLQEIRESFGSYIEDTKIDEIPVNPQYTDFKITF